MVYLGRNDKALRCDDLEVIELPSRSVIVPNYLTYMYYMFWDRHDEMCFAAINTFLFICIA